MPIEPALDDASRAILDGTPVDWSALQSSPDPETRSLAAELRVLSAVAGVHRAEATPPTPPARHAAAAGEAGGPGRWGNLELLEPVGAGASGEVYRAWDTRLDREVALKLLPAGEPPADGTSPVIQEGRLLARVRHPNVATIYGAEWIDGRIGLWMEFVRGRTLEDLIEAGQAFAPSEVIDIGLEVCRAVSAVHAAGLLHRDIKTRNVMRADDGRVVLMDFGTGREQADRRPAGAGTPLYLAPEAFRGQPATVRGDVYSVGVVLYRLLTGAYPVTAGSLEDLRRAHERADRTDLDAIRPDLPAGLVTVVRRATEADPWRRYESCDAMAAALASLASPRRARRWLATAVAAALAGVGVWLWSGAPGWRDPARGTPDALRAGLAVAPSTATAPPALVVVPFRNLWTEPDAGLLVDGLTHEVIHSLAGVPGLDVKSATSSFALAGRNLGMAEIGQQLGVSLVLEGSVIGSTSRWRVLVTLAHVGRDTPLWSREFDHDGHSLIEMRHEIARAVVDALGLSLRTGQRRYEPAAAVYMQYLRARALAERRGSADAGAAASLFREVIASDPDYAPAYAGLADAYSFLSQDLPDVGGMSPDEAVALMRPAAQTALGLDPLLAEAHAAVGFLHSREHAWDEADRAFLRAIELNPALTHVYTTYAFSTLLPMRRFDEAEALLEEALRRDPLSPIVLRDLAFGQINAGRFDEAIDNLRRALALDPSLPYSTLLLARALSFDGRLDEALPMWEARASEIGSQHWLAYAYVQAGRRAEVERMLAGHRNPYRLAIIHAALGDKDRALEALARAADESPQRVVRLLTYPEMTPLRGDPRFDAIRGRFRLP